MDDKSAGFVHIRSNRSVLILSLSCTILAYASYLNCEKLDMNILATLLTVYDLQVDGLHFLPFLMRHTNKHTHTHADWQSLRTPRSHFNIIYIYLLKYKLVQSLVHEWKLKTKQNERNEKNHKKLMVLKRADNSVKKMKEDESSAS